MLPPLATNVYSCSIKCLLAQKSHEKWLLTNVQFERAFRWFGDGSKMSSNELEGIGKRFQHMPDFLQIRFLSVSLSHTHSHTSSHLSLSLYFSVHCFLFHSLANLLFCSIIPLLLSHSFTLSSLSHSLSCSIPLLLSYCFSLLSLLPSIILYYLTHPLV